MPLRSQHSVVVLPHSVELHRLLSVEELLLLLTGLLLLLLGHLLLQPLLLERLEVLLTSVVVWDVMGRRERVPRSSPSKRMQPEIASLSL